MLDCRYVRLLVRRTTGTSDYKIYCRTTGPSKKIKVNGQELEAVTSFKYLGSVVSYEVSKPEILSRIAQTTAALTKLKPLWNDRSISLSSKIRLMRSLSHPSSCMLVNHGPSQQSSKEEYKP